MLRMLKPQRRAPVGAYELLTDSRAGQGGQASRKEEKAKSTVFMGEQIEYDVKALIHLLNKHL